MQHFASNEAAQYGTDTHYTYPTSLPLHHWAFKGKWNIGNEHSTSGTGGAALKLNFTSQKVFLVLGSATDKPLHATITLDGKTPKSSAGKDAPEGKLLVDKHILYELIAQPEHVQNTLEIKTQDAGLEAYAFTFGE